MYKATIFYSYGRGKRIRSTHYARTKIMAWLKAKFVSRYGNKDFFEIQVESV